MSRLQLGSIDIYDQASEVSSFIVSDIVNGGGYEDPTIISNTKDLYERFRFCDNYKAYEQIILNGASLALLGNRKQFNDFPSIAIFNQNPDIGDNLVSYANPRYEDLFKNIEQLAKELQEESEILSYNLFLVLTEARNDYEIFTVQDLLKYLKFVVRTETAEVIQSISKYTGDNRGEDYTYKIKIKPKTKYLSEEILRGIESGKVYTLVLPRKVEDSDYEFNDYGVLFQKEVSPDEYIPEKTNIPLTEKGIDGIVAELVVEEGESNLDILKTIVNAVNPRTGDKLYDLYYTRGEELYVAGVDTGDPYLVLETPYLIRAYDFCYQFCDLFEYENDIEFTQKILYTRGLINQGLVLSAYSKIANKEGRGIELEFAAKFGWMDLLVDFLGNSDEYVGKELLQEVSTNEYLTFTDINYKTHNYNGDEFESLVNKHVYLTKSWIPSDWDDRSTYLAYESLLEYEVPASVVIAPPDANTWRNAPLVPLLSKLTKSHVDGGTSATLCIQLNPDEGQLISTLGARLSVQSDCLFWFSGGNQFKSVYQYLIKYLRDKNFNSDPGAIVMDRVPDEYPTHTLTYTGYNIAYNNNPWKYVVSLGVSHVLNSIYFSVTPGMYLNEAKTYIQNATIEAVNSNPLINSVSINSIEQKNNILTVNVDIYYIKLSDVIKVNFKIYKTYA